MPRPKTDKIECSIDGCLRKANPIGLCKKHYDQKRHGRGIFRDFSKVRKRKDPNEFRIEGEVCFISLYSKNIKVAETIIDTEDVERCGPYRWYREISPNGDFRAKNVFVGYLSEFIMGFKSTFTMCVDHKDGNTLDNRKSNLQIITMQQNQFKKRKQKNNTSGYRGVYKIARCNKWMSEIKCDGIKYVLGRFYSKDEAAFVYNKMAVKLFGRFAVLNNVPIIRKKILKQTVQGC